MTKEAISMRAAYKANPEKFRVRARIWRADNPERAAEIDANRRLKQRYGITLLDKVQLLADQVGVCALCLKRLETLSVACVDHDHKSGKVRGILCIACNVALARLGDSYERLDKVALYLAAAENGYRYLPGGELKKDSTKTNAV